MYPRAHDAYLESRILSANPVELIRLLYQACIDSVREARRYLAEGDIPSRSRAISKACDILMELAGSLDQENGGEIGQRLLRLYEYMQRRLVEANFRQSDAALVEVLGLMTTLSEGWDGVKAPVEQSYAMPPVEAPTACISHAWSF